MYPIFINLRAESDLRACVRALVCMCVCVCAHACLSMNKTLCNRGWTVEQCQMTLACDLCIMYKNDYLTWDITLK